MLKKNRPERAAQQAVGHIDQPGRKAVKTSLGFGSKLAENKINQAITHGSDEGIWSHVEWIHPVCPHHLLHPGPGYIPDQVGWQFSLQQGGKPEDDDGLRTQGPEDQAGRAAYSPNPGTQLNNDRQDRQDGLKYRIPGKFFGPDQPEAQRSENTGSGDLHRQPPQPNTQFGG